METIYLFFSVFIEIMFKSYYVVWKPRDHQYFECAQREFKSYYVVWKLEIKKKIAYMETEFKSYYVVWKHRSPVIPNMGRGRLNRTMQYGNKNINKIIKIKYKSLNRTMQYGNTISHAENSDYIESLNRTMQYGNFFYFP